MYQSAKQIIAIAYGNMIYVGLVLIQGGFIFYLPFFTLYPLLAGFVTGLTAPHKMKASGIYANSVPLFYIIYNFLFLFPSRSASAAVSLTDFLLFPLLLIVICVFGQLGAWLGFLGKARLVERG